MDMMLTSYVILLFWHEIGRIRTHSLKFKFNVILFSYKMDLKMKRNYPAFILRWKSEPKHKFKPNFRHVQTSLWIDLLLDILDSGLTVPFKNSQRRNFYWRKCLESFNFSGKLTDNVKWAQVTFFFCFRSSVCASHKSNQSCSRKFIDHELSIFWLSHRFYKMGEISTGAELK